MTKLTFLGTSNAVPDKDHHNTHLIIESGKQVILVDCPGNPFLRLDQANINPLSITSLFLTHFHPDHVSGFPLLLMDMWLMKREVPLTIYGLTAVLDKCKKMMALYEWQDWDDLYRIIFYEIPKVKLCTLLESDDISIMATPVDHLIPTAAIRVNFPGGSICYSGDTAPCDDLVQLAKGVDILIHESTGEGLWHSSAAEAGEIANAAGVHKLYLIHYSPKQDPDELIFQANTNFPGEVHVAKDLMTLEF